MKLCGFEAGLDQPLFLIAGPCVIESRQLAHRYRRRAEGNLRRRWACRSSTSRPTTRPTAARIKSFRGLGMDEGLEILAEVQQEDRRAGADRRA